MKNPRPSQIKAAREAVQYRLGLGITEAQTWCAERVHTTNRVWRQWESGDRKMHAAFWDLFNRRKDEKN